MDPAIPIPPKGSNAKDRYGFAKMNLGDSFFTTTPQSTITGIAVYYAKRLGTKYTTRKVTEDGIHGIRVWRIK